jgi:hypothetical protein
VDNFCISGEEFPISAVAAGTNLVAARTKLMRAVTAGIAAACSLMAAHTKLMRAASILMRAASALMAEGTKKDGRNGRIVAATSRRAVLVFVSIILKSRIYYGANVNKK